ncbi:methyl-accepting chemotaxis protein [Tateyamaria armeniaca]|uniref:Methyl-accepting chemotaxis protein n=1 Tax=Tateyamaria armeniaca TaxID=2518930 RepID=A0ABW8UV52_9RHOB
MNVQMPISDITDILGQQADATGIPARVELLRGVEMLRANCARVGLYAALGMLVEGEADFDHCTNGIRRAMPGVHAALDLLIGTQPVPGIDPSALEWVRSVGVEMKESCDTMRRFVAATSDLEQRHLDRSMTMEIVLHYTHFAAGDFNAHFAALVNRLGADLRSIREARQNGAEATGETARAALKEISEISRHVGLIAINASIEAAHVGDQGKGFAIIASEIRELSSKIEEANTRVQGQVDALIQTIEQS